MTASFELKKILLADKNASTNRDGLKPLFVLAESLATEESPERINEIQRQILLISLDDLDIEQVNSLNSFIYYSKIDRSPILKQFLKYIKDSQKDEKTSLKLASILRFIVESDKTLLNLSDIRKEEALKKYTPWLWIDCLTFYDWNLAIEEISKLLNAGNQLNNLLVRIPSYKIRAGKEIIQEAIKKWYPNIPTGNERNTLQKWANNFNIHLGLSIAMDNQLDKIPYYQDSIM